MARWGDEKTLFFIACYKDQECLWNPASYFYRSKIARRNAYTSFLEQFHDKNLTVPLLKTKIKNIRTTYHQELNKIRYSQQTGAAPGYKPTLCWFEALDAFLGETLQKELTNTVAHCNAQFSSHTDVDVKLDSVTLHYRRMLPVREHLNIGFASICLLTMHCKLQSCHDTDLTTPQISIKFNNFKRKLLSSSKLDCVASGHTSSGNNLEFTQVAELPSDEQEPTAKKQIRLVTNKLMKSQGDDTDSDKSYTPNQMDNTSNIINTPGLSEDEFHFFGMNVAAQLRRLPLHIALQLQTEFQNTLYLARINAQATPPAADNAIEETTLQTIEVISDDESFEHDVDEKEFPLDIQDTIELQVDSDLPLDDEVTNNEFKQAWDAS